MTEVRIEFVLNGWIATVGCRRVVFTDKDQLLKDLSNFLDDPGASQKHFIETSINKDVTNPMVTEVTEETEGIEIDWNRARAVSLPPDVNSL